VPPRASDPKYPGGSCGAVAQRLPSYDYVKRADQAALRFGATDAESAGSKSAGGEVVATSVASVGHRGFVDLAAATP